MRLLNIFGDIAHAWKYHKASKYKWVKAQARWISFFTYITMPTLLASSIIFYEQEMWALIINLFLITYYLYFLIDRQRNERTYVWVKYLAPPSQFPLYINDKDEHIKEFVTEHLKTGKYIRKIPQDRILK